MPDVRQEAASLFGGLLEPFRHAVEGSDHLAHRSAFDFRNPHRVVAAREFGCGVNEPADRKETGAPEPGEVDECDHAQRPEKPGPMEAPIPRRTRE